MKSFSEARRIAHQIASMYNLDYDEVFERIKDMSSEEFRTYKSDLQSKKTLHD